MGSIISGAVITSNGNLTPSFEYIAGLREAQSRVNVPGDFSSEKKVNSQMFPAVESKCHITYNFEKHNSCVIIFQALVLGAGFVSAPVIDYLTRDSSLGVTVAAAIKEEANKLATRYHKFLVCSYSQYRQNTIIEYKFEKIILTFLDLSVRSLYFQMSTKVLNTQMI